MIEYFVSQNGCDAWSGHTPEVNASRTDGPFASVEKARDTIRARQRQGGPTGPVTVWIGGGRYPLAAPLVFTPADSGPVTYNARPGETPIFDGGAPIGGWRKTSVNSHAGWVADVSALVRDRGGFRQLFVNGRRATRPRLPKTGFYRAAADPRETPDGFILDTVPGDITIHAQPGVAELVCMSAWVADRKAVTELDSASNRIVAAGKLCRHIRKDTRFYLDNVRGALSQPGEWYLDLDEGRVWYLPLPGETLDALDAVAAFTPRMLEFEGSPDTGRFVEELVFSGLTFEHGDWPEHVISNQADVQVPAVIALCGVRNCRLENCRVRRCGWYGLEIGEACTGVTVAGCEFSDLGAGGIKIGGCGSEGSVNRRTGQCLIRGNTIHHCGRVFHSSVGILLRHAYDTELSGNEICDLYYSGISCGWVWGYGANVTRDIRILNNHIRHIGHGWLKDMGGIYTLGVQPGTVIRGNHIHDVSGDGITWGIYLDEGSSEIVVEGNLCHDISSGGFHIHYGRDNVVRNNILAFTGDNLVSLTHGPNAPYGPYSQCGDQHTCAFTFERNILVGDGWPAYVKYMTGCTHLEDRLFRSDHNLYWDVSGEPLRWAGDDWHCIDITYGKVYDRTAWQALGYDRNTICADPKFRNLAARDFRLQPDSPALAWDFPMEVLHGMLFQKTGSTTREDKRRKQ